MNDMARVAERRMIEGVEAPARFTIDEFMHLVEMEVFEPFKVELVEGVIVRMSPSQPPHTFYKMLVFRALEAVYTLPLNGLTVSTELTLNLGPATVREADLGVTAPFPADAKEVDIKTVHLLVEISKTTLAYDLSDKARDYAAAGVPHYWVVDIAGGVTNVMQLADGCYGKPQRIPFGEPIPAPGTADTIIIA